MAWLILLAAAAFEIAFALSLKPSEGFSRLWPTAGVLGSAAASLPFPVPWSGLRRSSRCRRSVIARRPVSETALRDCSSRSGAAVR